MLDMETQGVMGSPMKGSYTLSDDSLFISAIGASKKALRQKCTLYNCMKAKEKRTQ